MKKKTTKKVEKITDETTEPSPMPMLTFTDEETKQFADFLNFVYLKTKTKELDWEDATKVGVHLIHARKLLRKMEDHVFEVGKLVKTK